MDKVAKELITNILKSCVNRTITRIKQDKTFRPFHEALLTNKLVIASAFERSFSTSFGQGPMEETSMILANATGAESVRHKETMVNITKAAQDEISRITSSLRSGDAPPNWKKEIQRVLACKKGDFVVTRVISDLWMKRHGVEYFFSLKTVKPNIDQTEIAKRDMLTLKAHQPDSETFFALYYNPGGNTRKDYNWSVPFKIFDMINDPCVLIGEEYWDIIGGKGTYHELLEIFGAVGAETRKKLQDLGH